MAQPMPGAFRIRIDRDHLSKIKKVDHVNLFDNINSGFKYFTL